MATNTTRNTVAAPATQTVLSFAEKRAALQLAKPAAPKAPSGLRNRIVGVLGGSVSAVKSFGSDIVTEYKYQEAVRKGEL